MASTETNIILKGVSGMLGGQVVLKQINGKTVICKAPPKRGKNVPDTQKKQMSRFQQAVAYARKMISEPNTRALYAAKTEPGKRVFNRALADFMKPPVVHEIDTFRCSGRAGDEITVKATDDFLVTGVKVSLYGPDRALIEQGECTPGDVESVWVYSLHASFDEATICQVTAAARDFAGNETVAVVDLCKIPGS